MMSRRAATLITHRPLTPADLLPCGPLTRIGRALRIFDEIGSTNAYLRGQAAMLGDGAVTLAESQTAGRGRLGRRWDSPRGASILLSVLLIEFERSPVLELGALLGSLAACEAIETTTDVTPNVRWPNDIAVGPRKLGGVLAETFPTGVPVQGEARTVGLLIGIGINCLQQRGHFRGELAHKATSLEIESSRPVERAAIAAALLARLDAWLGGSGTHQHGERLRAAWRARCGDVGTRVTLEHDGRAFAGTMLDIDDAGNLILQLDQGGRRCFAAATTTRSW